jgi:hypothetical protein
MSMAKPNSMLLASAKSPPVGELNEVRLFYAPSARSARSAKQSRLCRGLIKKSSLHRGIRGLTSVSTLYQGIRGYVAARLKTRGCIEAFEA